MDDDLASRSASARPCSGFMAQRTEPRDSLDDFPTPPWATRALVAHVVGAPLGAVWEPACGRGHMARALAESAREVFATDVADYRADPAPAAGWGGQDGVQDFLDPSAQPRDGEALDWIVTNPPFRHAADFVLTALRLRPRRGVAMLVRSAFLEGINRYRSLYLMQPPSTVAQFSERVPIFRGRLDPKASTATPYCWVVWEKDGPPGTRLVWIPPCRRNLEREADYPGGQSQ